MQHQLDNVKIQNSTPLPDRDGHIPAFATATEAKTHEGRIALEQITFKTLHSAWPAKINFACASWAGGGASR
jgi:hypothetical protein